MADHIDDSDFCVLNQDAPTRATADTISSPDITLASAELMNTIEWHTENALCSDHVTIIISISRTFVTVSSENKTFINFTKADGQSFTTYTENKFVNQPPPTSVSKGEKTFKKIIDKARKLFIPAGRIPMIRPGFPSSAALLADERDTLKPQNPGDERIGQLNNKIHKLLTEHRRAKWEQHLESAHFNSGTNNLWKTLKSLTNKSTTNQNNTISFDNKPIHNNRMCANHFNRQFTENIHHDRNMRKIIRKIRKLDCSNDNMVFAISEVDNAIKKSKNSKSMGPDNISAIMLKKLAVHGITFLTALLNLSIRTLSIPYIWKVERIIPLAKPGKPIMVMQHHTQLSQGLQHNNCAPSDTVANIERSKLKKTMPQINNGGIGSIKGF